MKTTTNPIGRLVKIGKASLRFFPVVVFLTVHGSPLQAENLAPNLPFPKVSPEQVEGLRKTAESGDLDAIHQLGRCYYFGNGEPKDLVEAAKWFRKGAEGGYAKSQNNLGLAYLNGEGVPKDEVEAVKWLRKAADQGLSISENTLGACYFKGKGVPRNTAEAAKWFQKAAEHGLANAQDTLGWCYKKGEGVTQDQLKAVKWFEMAAKQRDSTAQIHLAQCYLEGGGVPKDEVAAYMWLSIAASSGDAEANKMQGLLSLALSKNQLAEALRMRRELKLEPVANAKEAKPTETVLDGHENPPEGIQTGGIEAFREHAEKGDAKAQYVLGGCYLLGKGVAKDEAAAYMWLSLASESGSAESKPLLENLALQMPVEQIEKALQKKMDWSNKRLPPELDTAKAEVVKQTGKVESRTAKSNVAIPVSREDGEIPKITTASGITYSNVRIRSRDGDSVRISYSDGFKTLRFSELDRGSAELLGVVDYENEIAASKQAAVDYANAEIVRQQREKNARRVRIEAKEIKFKAIKNKQKKTIDDWATMAALRHAFSAEQMKRIIGPPPFYVSGASSCWQNACWSPLSEKWEDLWFEKKTDVSTYNGISALEGVSHFDNYYELRSGIETRKIQIPSNEEELNEAYKDEVERVLSPP